MRDTATVRILAVIGGELMGADERNDWAVLDALLAANGPTPIEVRVMALVEPQRGSIVFGSPLSRAVGIRASAGSGIPEAWGRRNPAESARQRLDRALQHLRELGLRASGDIEPDDAYRAVCREAARRDYERVLVLLNDHLPWRRRLFGRALVVRLRRALAIPVDVPGRAELAPPSS